MKDIEFSKDEKDRLVDQVQRYLSTELDCEAGQFDTEFFVDFIIKELAPKLYNQGLLDAQAVLSDKIDQIIETISELER
jgi:uncharacterized protein (DUF2164 family)